MDKRSTSAPDLKKSAHVRASEMGGIRLFQITFCPVLSDGGSDGQMESTMAEVSGKKEGNAGKVRE